MLRNAGLWYVAKDRVEIRPEELLEPADGEMVVRALFSGVSRGTERLVLGGRVPASEHRRMRCPHQMGAFPFPVKYGYALVGVIQSGPRERIGQEVFVLHPHQQYARVPIADVHLLPAGVSAKRAALAANMETALNVVWDAGVAPGERVLVVGGGVVGLLAAAIAAGIAGTEVTVVDPESSRAPVAERLGARFATPAAAPAEQDAVIHASGTEEGLRLALDSAGTEAVVAEASWFGACRVSVPLGGAFHSRRLRLVSSQVGAVPATHRPRWTTARRLGKALDLLRDETFDALITGEIAFHEAPSRLPAILAERGAGLATVLRYQ